MHVLKKLFTGLIMYLPSQSKEHCIVLYCIVCRAFFCPQICMGFFQAMGHSIILFSASSNPSPMEGII